MSEIVQVEIARIYTDGGTQIRASLYDDETLAEYLEALEAGATFPPVELVDDGKKLWLVDGFHRHAAHLRARKSVIDAHVTKGTLEEARWRACAANLHNGLRRSAEDKRSAVKAALVHPKSGDLSDRAIARHVGVGDQLVANVRAELQVRDHAPVSKQTRTGRDGKKYPAPVAHRAAPPPSRVVDREPVDDDEPPPPDEDAWSEPAPRRAEPARAPVTSAAVLCDVLGTPVPTPLVAAWKMFHARGVVIAEHLMAAKSAASAMRADLTRMQSSDPLPLIDAQQTNQWRITPDINAAARTLEDYLPYVVCPECEGSNRLGCRYCRSAGWLSKSRHEERLRGAAALAGARR